MQPDLRPPAGTGQSHRTLLKLEGAEGQAIPAHHSGVLADLAAD